MAFKKIVEYTSEELDAAVRDAEGRIPDFYVILKGVDAYFERRKRKENSGISPPLNPSGDGSFRGPDGAR